MKRKRTEFETLLILDAAANRRMRKVAGHALKAWHSGVQNGTMYALRLFRKHKKEGRL
jgi:hypothetical protein